MTKLEELRAAVDDAYDAFAAAYVAYADYKKELEKQK